LSKIGRLKFEFDNQPENMILISCLGEPELNIEYRIFVEIASLRHFFDSPFLKLIRQRRTLIIHFSFEIIHSN